MVLGHSAVTFLQQRYRDGLHCALLLGSGDQPIPDRIASTKVLGVTNDEQVALGTSHSYVETSLIAQETDAPRLCSRSDTAENNNVLLLSLEAIDRVEVDPFHNVETITLLEGALQLKNLSLVHGHHADSIIEVLARVVDPQSFVESQRHVGLFSVDDGMHPARRLWCLDREELERPS